MSLPLITADDWGLSPGINEGILDLARRGVVRRVSVLATGGYVTVGLAELKALSGVAIGLHFSLTFGGTRRGADIGLLARPDGQFYPSPARVAGLWLLAGRKRREQLRREADVLLQEQLAVLHDNGIAPVYLDGHHHIHLVPGVMEALVVRLREQGISRVRVPYDPARLCSRVAPVVVLAGRARWRWPHLGLTFLRCVYPAAADYQDASRLARIVARSGGCELVVHPALRDDETAAGIPDHYPGDRVLEYRVLCSLEPAFAGPTGVT